jgi:hypothetical protein
VGLCRQDTRLEPRIRKTLLRVPGQRCRALQKAPSRLWLRLEQVFRKTAIPVFIRASSACCGIVHYDCLALGDYLSRIPVLPLGREANRSAESDEGRRFEKDTNDIQGAGNPGPSREL